MATTKKSTASKQAFSAEEKAAMRAKAKEEREGAEGEKAIADAIASMPKDDQVIAQRLHELISTAAPTLTPRTWYGMPAYAKDGKVLCFFQGAYKFKSRYAMLGFSDEAALDEGSMWPTYYALTKFTKQNETTIRALLKQALS